MSIAAARDILNSIIERTSEASYVVPLIRRALDQLPPDDYQPEHARPLPGVVTYGAQRALQSILDMTNEHRGGMAPETVDAISMTAARGLDSIDAAGPLAPSEWSSTGDEGRDVEQMRGQYHPAYVAGAAWARADIAAAQTRNGGPPADQPVPDQSDAQLEVVPLPRGQFLLLLSGWPRALTVEEGDRLRETTGAASVIVTGHPVYAPDAVRSGANAAALLTQSMHRATAAERLQAVIAYAHVEKDQPADQPAEL